MLALGTLRRRHTRLDAPRCAGLLDHAPFLQWHGRTSWRRGSNVTARASSLTSSPDESRRAKSRPLGREAGRLRARKLHEGADLVRAAIGRLAEEPVMTRRTHFCALPPGYAFSASTSTVPALSLFFSSRRNFPRSFKSSGLKLAAAGIRET